MYQRKRKDNFSKKIEQMIIGRNKRSCNEIGINNVSTSTTVPTSITALTSTMAPTLTTITVLATVTIATTTAIATIITEILIKLIAVLIKVELLWQDESLLTKKLKVFANLGISRTSNLRFK